MSAVRLIVSYSMGVSFPSHRLPSLAVNLKTASSKSIANYDLLLADAGGEHRQSVAAALPLVP